MFGKSGKYLGLRGVKLQIAVGVIAGMDFLGVTGGLLTLNSFRSQFPSIDPNAPGVLANSAEQSNRSTYQGITVASYNVGCFLGAILCIFIGNPLGRRRTIFLGSSIIVIGEILQCSSYQLVQFILGQIVTGIGNGLNTSTGTLITGGIMIAYWLDFGFYFLDPNPVSWRFPLAFQIVFCFFHSGMPESPRWLVLKGKDAEAMHVLAYLNDLPESSTRVHSEYPAIKDTVLEMQKGSFKDLFTMGPDRHFHRTVLAYVNQVFQQISGINLITYYIPNVLEGQVGLSPTLAKLIAACNGTEYFLASWFAVFTVERFGRRQLMLFGAAGMSISMIILAITDSIGNTKAGIAQTVFLFIVPLRIRAPADALSTSGDWLFNFIVVMITPVAFNNIKYKTYIIFAVINAFIFPVVYFFYPETAYRSLEEMDSIFQKTKSIFTVVKRAKEEPRRYGKNGELLINYEETEEHTVRGGRARRLMSIRRTGHHPLLVDFHVEALASEGRAQIGREALSRLV
ncbi:major facilitator superfamily transporter monosaccharide [Acephala macrosclerotiorum]|nr:major facilitator superfamily transporter monosaccharide [Acephala macrosclerotiorum]